MTTCLWQHISFLNSEEYQWLHVSLEVSHTAEAISLFLSQVFDEWDLTNKLHVVVRDNGMNVVAAMTCGLVWTCQQNLKIFLETTIKDWIVYCYCSLWYYKGTSGISSSLLMWKLHYDNVLKKGCSFSIFIMWMILHLLIFSFVWMMLWLRVFTNKT